MRFAEVLSNVTSTLCLHPLCEFVYEVAVTFSDFYTTCYCVEKNEQGWNSALTCICRKYLPNR